MTVSKRLLVMAALKKFGIIYPCSGAADFSGAFTQDFGYLLFWFNDANDSTHIVKVRNNASYS